MTLLADGAADALNPFHWLTLIYTALAGPIEWALVHMESFYSGLGPLKAIGSFGLAVMTVTLAIRILLFPLFGWQLRTQRRIQAEQRRIAPEMAALRKKYKGEPRVLQEEMMKLYKEHDISPLSQMSGCLPLLIQLPILGGLYNGIRDASGQVGSTSFLWIADLNKSAKEAAGDFAIGAFVTHPWVLLLPALAAAATFVQSKIMMQPERANMSPQERQQYSLGKNMAYFAPLMVFVMGLLFPQGLALYWMTQSFVMIAQEWYLLGWGTLPVPPWFPGAGRVTALSYNQPPEKVIESSRHHGHAVETRPVKPSPGKAGANGKAAANGRTPATARARAAAGNGRVQTGKGAARPTTAGARPAARPPAARSGNTARGGKRRRGR